MAQPHFHLNARSSLLQAAAEDIDNANSTVKGWKSRAALKWWLQLKCATKNNHLLQSTKENLRNTMIAVEGPREKRRKMRRKQQRKPRKPKRMRHRTLLRTWLTSMMLMKAVRRNSGRRMMMNCRSDFRGTYRSADSKSGRAWLSVCHESCPIKNFEMQKAKLNGKFLQRLLR